MSQSLDDFILVCTPAIIQKQSIQIPRLQIPRAWTQTIHQSYRN